MKQETKLDLNQEFNDLIIDLDHYTWQEEEYQFAEKVVQRLKAMYRQYGTELGWITEKLEILSDFYLDVLIVSNNADSYDEYSIEVDIIIQKTKEKLKKRD